MEQRFGTIAVLINVARIMFLPPVKMVLGLGVVLLNGTKWLRVTGGIDHCLL